MTKMILLVLTLAMMTGEASAQQAQQRTIYDSTGKVIGRTATDGQGTVTTYDSSGRITGRTSTDSSGTKTIFDDRGNIIGRTTPTPQR